MLQIADMVTGMTNKRPYREPLGKEKVIIILQEEIAKNRLDRQAVNTFINFYDSIMEEVKKESAQVMKTYQTLNSQYEQLSKRFKK